MRLSKQFSTQVNMYRSVNVSVYHNSEVLYNKYIQSCMDTHTCTHTRIHTVTRLAHKLHTSECFPGCSNLLQLSQRRQLGCQSYPSEHLRSAKGDIQTKITTTQLWINAYYMHCEYMVFIITSKLTLRYVTSNQQH